MSTNSKIVLLGIAVILIAVYLLSRNNIVNKAVNLTLSPSPSSGLTRISQTPNPSLLSLGKPIDKAGQRVTKKPFGIYVSPGNSPVSPERFTGYHTGVDFETLPEEANTPIQIYVICDGLLLEKITATGYGGVAVQRCELSGQPITVVYGHIKLSSISAKTGRELKMGESLAILGAAYSSETGGERKHLHLGIHKGSSINIKGYVQTKPELTSWLDITKYW